MPTEAEWTAEGLSWDISGFASPLKLPMLGGERNIGDGTIRFYEESPYWSSTVFQGSARYIAVTISGGKSRGDINAQWRGFGFSVRCIKD